MQTALKVESRRLFKQQNPESESEDGTHFHIDSGPGPGPPPLFLRQAQNMAKSGTWLKCALGTWNCQSKYVKHGSVCPWLLHHFFLSIFPYICSALERCLPSYMYECPGFFSLSCPRPPSRSRSGLLLSGSWLLATASAPLLQHLFVSKHVSCLWPAPQEVGIEWEKGFAQREKLRSSRDGGSQFNF